MTPSNFQVSQHLGIIKTAVLPDFQITNSADWVSSNIVIDNKPISFVGREYQHELFSCKARSKVVLKSAQLGISIFSLCETISFLHRNSGTKVIYVLPTASFSSVFSKTRFTPLIDGSPNLRDCLKCGNDSATSKIFTNSSQLFFKGGSSGQSISIDSDYNIFDELDWFTDPGILSQYSSRLIASEHKKTLKLSTPTLPGRGIAAEFDTSKQFIELQKCQHCNTEFQVDYLDHVKLPGLNVPLSKSSRSGFKSKRIEYLNHSTRNEFQNYDFHQAYIACPSCGESVDTNISNRRWVCVNPSANIEKVGYHITCFQAPEFISLAYLISESASYTSFGDFRNFMTGVPYESSENTLTKEDLESVFLPNMDVIPYAIMGVDLGSLSYVTIAVPSNDRSGFRVVHVEGIPLSQLDERLDYLKRVYRVILTVSDSLPYTSDVIRWQHKDHNLWGAVFTSSKNVELFTLAERGEDKTKAMFGMKQINVNRDKMLDHIVDLIRAQLITFNTHCKSNSSQNPKNEIIRHLQDLKRSKVTDKVGDVSYHWIKSTAGNDHIFFSLLYCTLALYMAGRSAASSPLPSLLYSIKCLTGPDRPVSCG